MKNFRELSRHSGVWGRQDGSGLWVLVPGSGGSTQMCLLIHKVSISTRHHFCSSFLWSGQTFPCFFHPASGGLLGTDILCPTGNRTKGQDSPRPCRRGRDLLRLAPFPLSTPAPEAPQQGCPVSLWPGKSGEESTPLSLPPQASWKGAL